MGLSRRQRKELQEALVDAFPTKASLEQMLSFELDKNLDAIAGGDNLQDIVFNLIKKAEAEGWVEELILAARRANPENPKLQAIKFIFSLFSNQELSFSKKSRFLPFTALGFSLFIGISLSFTRVGIFQKFFFNSDSLVKLVDVSIDNNTLSPNFDIKLRNIGTKSAVLKEAEFQILQIWKIETQNKCKQSSLGISDIYEFLLPESLDFKKPYIFKTKISNYIEPNQPERISFTFGVNKLNTCDDYIYHIKGNLVADEDNKKIEIPDILLLASHCECDFETNMNNRKKIIEISNIQGIKSEKIKFFEEIINDTAAQVPVQSSSKNLKRHLDKMKQLQLKDAEDKRNSPNHDI